MNTLVIGSDSGLGWAVAVLFAREGADVAVRYLNEQKDVEETRRCVEVQGGRCLLISGDVKNRVFYRAAVDQVAKEFGELNVRVNDAAFPSHADPIDASCQ